MTVKTISSLIPTLTAVALASENIKVAKKKKKTTKDMVGLGMKNILGIGIIKLESNLISSL